MAKQTHSAVFALKVETTEGTYVDPGAATDFTALREGFSFDSKVDTVQSNELVNDIGAAQSFTGAESPSGSIPKYFKHSGIEGTAPDYALMIKSAIGAQATRATERATAASSTAGTATAAAVLNILASHGSEYVAGDALLIKDGANGYNIRNVKSVSTDALTLNYNLGTAPAAGVNTGKNTLFAPASSGHPTFTAHLYQAASSAAFHQAIVGCRTTQMQMEFPANDLAAITFDFEGNGSYMNPITITAATKYIDFDYGSTDFLATLTVKTYKTPHDLAREIATKMSDGGAATISCSYSNLTGKFTISKASGTLNLLWNTGSNTANSAAAKLGFSTAADSTGALTYTSTTAQSYDPAYTPSYDSASPNVVRYNELCIGDYTRYDNRKCSNVSLTVATPRTAVKDLSAETGVSESVVLSREVTFSCTLVLQAHEIGEFDALLNNSTTSLMFNHGPKSNGQWVAGKCVNLYMPNVSITGNVIDDENGYMVVKLEGKGFVTSTLKDLYINFV
jgi:hypothetical protein